ncbi:MAG: hypothetical protein QME71_01500 [Dehalococcoidia bacterium]|nr:hypothetical protein [Dehalococcoidia bacterium]
MVYLLFFVTAAVIIVAGVALAYNGETIAERTGLGRIWIGAFLIAGTTSLPELVTSSVAVVRDAPDLATGDIFGANMVNMLILGILGLLFGRAWEVRREPTGIALAAAVAILITATAGVFSVSDSNLNLGTLSLASPLLVAIAVGSAFLLRQYEERIVHPSAERQEIERRAISLRSAVIQFVIAGAAILAAGPLLIVASEEIAKEAGLSESFFGVAALALVTTLPELVTSASAMRLGSIDLAIGNLFGSCITNMAILAWLDLLYVKGPLFETVGPSQVAAAMAGIAMMTTALIAVNVRRADLRLHVQPAAAALIVTYVIGLLLVYQAD